MLYVKFFDGKDGRMDMELFRELCIKCDYSAECVDCEAGKLGYKYYPETVFGIALIDMIGFEFPYEVYEVMK